MHFGLCISEFVVHLVCTLVCSIYTDITHTHTDAEDANDQAGKGQTGKRLTGQGSDLFHPISYLSLQCLLLPDRVQKEVLFKSHKGRNS